jgi:geranylgeranyl pyrophosphate synthase
MAYKLSGKSVPEGVWQAAMATELVHTALLMHDDFMDQDVLRRGMPTTQAYFGKQHGKHFGDSMAVCAGDVVLSLGFETLVKCGLPAEMILEATAHLQRTVTQTAIGQAHDVAMGFVPSWTEDDVLAVYKAKTSLYTYENPLILGAIFAGLSKEICEILKTYALYGGLAFQIHDDILGVFGDSEKTGKSTDSDLRQGKRTLLALKTLEMGTKEQKVAFELVWGKEAANSEEIDRAKKAILESGALEYTRNLATDFANKAVEALEELRKLDVDQKSVDFLQGVAIYTVERSV